MDDFSIIPAQPSDAQAISELILGFIADLAVHPDGRGTEQFMKHMQPDAIRGYITSDNIDYRKAVIDGHMAGVVALRDGRHLQHLFVASQYQRRGVARALWNDARTRVQAVGKVDGITVNSSLAALPVYLKFGFLPTGPRIEKDGVAYVPMRWDTQQT